jgi:hypothetical protein
METAGKEKKKFGTYEQSNNYGAFLLLLPPDFYKHISCN